MKKTLVSVLSLCLVLVMLLALVSCGDGKDSSGNSRENYDGTYYYYTNGACDMSSYIRLSGDNWSDETGASGKFTVSGGNITLKYVVNSSEPTGAVLISMGMGKNGDVIDLMAGTIGDGKVTFNKSMGIDLGSAAVTLYLNGVVPGGTNGNTANNGNAGAESKYDGTYYMYAGGNECDMNSYIRLNGDSWSDEAGGYGRCVISGGSITLKYAVDSSEPTGALVISMGMANEGDVIDLMAGTVSDGKLTFTHSLGVALGSETIVCYLNGVVK